MKLITTLFILSLLLYSNSSLPASQRVYHWKIAEMQSDNRSEQTIANHVMMKYVKTLSNGKLIITTASENNTPQTAFEQIKKGKFQMGYATANDWQKTDPDMQLFSSLPFGMITPEIHAWFYEGGGIDLMEKVYAKHGLLSFPGGSYDTQMGGWFTKPIKSVNDFNGLRMHIQGVASDVVEKLGVRIINNSRDNLLEQIKSGKLDAVEWAGPASDIDMRFAEVASYYYTAWHKPSSESQFLINQAAYNALPDNLQYVLKTAMRLASYDAYIQTKHNNALKLNQLKATFPNLKIQAFPTNVMIALKRHADQNINELASQSDMAKQIVDSLKTYQTQIRLWTRIGDQAYLNNLGI